MQRDEGIAAIFGREAGAGIEYQAGGGRMGVEQHVRRDGRGDLATRILGAPDRVGILADIGVRIAVEAALPDTREVIGRQVVAQPVALIGGDINGVRAGRDCDPYWIANAAGEFAHAAVGIDLEDLRPGLEVGDIVPRSQRQIERAVRPEGDVAGDMAALGPQVRHLGGDLLRRAGCRLPILIGEAPDAAQIADIEIAVMEGQAMRIDKARRGRKECEPLVRLAVAIGIAQQGDLAAALAGLGQEDIAIGRHRQPAGIAEIVGKDRDRKSPGHFRHGAGRPGHVGGLVGDRRGGIGLDQAGG